MVAWQSSPSDWGWQCVDNVWHPVWMTLLTAAHLCPAVIKQDAPRSDASGSVQTCPVQLCVIVRENVTEKMTLSSFLSDSETNYTASCSLSPNSTYSICCGFVVQLFDLLRTCCGFHWSGCDMT